MYSRIVIAVDGSEEARHAARLGLHVARAFDATVDVLHVIDREARRLTRGDEEAQRLRERGERLLATVEALASELGHPVSTAVEVGRPAVEIDAFAAERDADLVVVGRQGLSGLGRRLLGGVTERLLHRSEVPVLVVPQGTAPEEPAFERVLLPTDGSANAEAATPHGVAFARQYGAVTHVVTVVDLQAAGGPFSAGGLDAEFVERLEAEGQEAVDRLRERIHETDPDFAVETSVVRSTSFDGVAAGVREYVVDADIDLLVMGSRGRSSLRRQLLGSVASTLLRTVDVPVLVVSWGS